MFANTDESAMQVGRHGVQRVCRKVGGRRICPRCPTAKIWEALPMYGLRHYFRKRFVFL
jgi:hypothetical protein